MILLLLLLIPFLSGLVLLLFRNASVVRYLALAATAANLAATALLLAWPTAAFPAVDWIQALGIRFSLGYDGVSLVMISLTNLIFPFIVLAGFHRAGNNVPALNALILITQSALNGVFLAQNAVLFYVFWELALIPVYFILLIWGGDNRKNITFKFFMYTLTGSLFLLFGIIYLYQLTPGHTTDFSAFEQLQVPEPTQRWLFWVLFIAFAIKMPLFPFHTWQPATYKMASTQGGMILAGAMTKMGVYGALRFLLPVIPEGVGYWQNTVIVLGLAGVVYASVIAFRQTNLKMWIAYSSMAHISLMAAGIFALNSFALRGLLFQAFSHGVTIVALFYVVCMIREKTGTLELPQLGGLKHYAPRLALLLLIVVLNSVALPLTAGFAGEFLIITGLFKESVWYALLGGTTMVFGAVYMLFAYQQIMLGSPRPVFDEIGDMRTIDYFVLAPLVGLVLALGIYPQPVFDLLEMSAASLQSLITPVAGVLPAIVH